MTCRTILSLVLCTTLAACGGDGAGPAGAEDGLGSNPADRPSADARNTDLPVDTGAGGAVDALTDGHRPDGSASDHPLPLADTGRADAQGPLGDASSDALGDASSDALGDASSGAPGDASSDALGDASSGALGDASSGALGDASTDAPGDASSDALGDASADALGDASTDAPVPDVPAAAPDAGLPAPACAVDAECDGGGRCIGGLCGEVTPCFAEADCLNGRDCRAARCVTFECDAHVDCGPGARCLDFECVPDDDGACRCAPGYTCRQARCDLSGPCGQDADCPLGGVCYEGICSECRFNNQCPRLTFCGGGTCQQEAICVNDAVCMPGRFCDPSAQCVPIEGNCQDDGLGNHSVDDAYPLTEMTLAGLIACDGTEDWYVVDEPTAFVVSLRTPELISILIEVYQPDNIFRPVDYDLGRVTESRVSAPAGRYYLRVYPPPGSTARYQLDVRPGCADDIHERPWRNDTVAGASPLPRGDTTGSICAGDVDIFRHLSMENVEVRLQVLAGRVTATSGGQALPQVLGQGGLVEVRGDPGSEFLLHSEPRADAGVACLQAQVAALGMVAPIFLNAGQDNFSGDCLSPSGPDRAYVIDLPVAAGGTGLDVRLTGASPRTSVAVYSPCGQPALGCVNGIEKLHLDALPGGRYWVVVDGQIDGTIGMTRADGGLCAHRPPLRPNFETAFTFPETPGSLAGGCLADQVSELAFALNIPVASRIDVEVTGQGMLTAALRGVCGDAATERGCIARQPNPVLHFDRVEAGDYTLVIEGAGTARMRVVQLPL